jgi:hypothetical protein
MAFLGVFGQFSIVIAQKTPPFWPILAFWAKFGVKTSILAIFEHFWAFLGFFGIFRGF